MLADRNAGDEGVRAMECVSAKALEVELKAPVRVHRSVQVDLPAAEPLAQFFFNLGGPEDADPGFGPELPHDTNVACA